MRYFLHNLMLGFTVPDNGEVLNAIVCSQGTATAPASVSTDSLLLLHSDGQSHHSIVTSRNHF